MKQLLTIGLIATLVATSASPVVAFNAEELDRVRSGQDCRDCNLSGANLQGVNLRGLDLSGADFYGANLGSSNLGVANLIGADLRRADLYNAILSGATLRGAIFCQTVMPDGTLRNDNC